MSSFINFNLLNKSAEAMIEAILKRMVELDVEEFYVAYKHTKLLLTYVYEENAILIVAFEYGVSQELGKLNGFLDLKVLAHLIAALLQNFTFDV